MTDCICYGRSDGKFQMHGSGFARQCPLVPMVKTDWAESWEGRVTESGLF